MPSKKKKNGLDPQLSPELSLWCSEVCSKVRALSPWLHQLYSAERNLPHYLALASLFERQFQDTILARSAFLHGTPITHLEQLPSGYVDDEIYSLLKEREKLRALNVQNLNAEEQFLAEVLPSLRRARTIVLFILEQLHHLDPEEKIAKWSLRFHRSPRPLPRGLPEAPQYKHGQEKESLRDFSRNVVAPTAKFFGLWRERNIIEDATLLYYFPGRLQDLLGFAMQASKPNGECQRLVAIVRDRVVSLIQPQRVSEILWEWRHIGSLDRQLPQLLPRTQADSRRLLYRVGFVSIICQTSADCYHILHSLHSQFPHRPTELRDSIGQPTVGGYRAIHTILTSPGAPDAIAVRILPRTANRSKWHRADPRKLVAIEKRFQSHKGLGLRVFTPDGRSVQVPVGATVLDFAYELNNRWVAFLYGATINRQPVDVLHRLAPNDIVWLNLAPEPQPLPPDWEQRVLKDSVKKIRHQLKRHYRRLLITEGRRWLREQLLSRDIRFLPDDDQMDTFIEEAIDRLKSPLKKAKAIIDRKSWLLQQLGLLAVSAQGKSLPFPFEVSSRVLEEFVDAITGVIENAMFITLNELILPEDLISRLKGVSFCDSCRPSRREQWIGKETDLGILVLHRVGAKCSTSGIPVSRLRLSAAPRYLVIETTNRVGVGADVLSVFRRHRVNLVEMAGRQIGPALGVIRVQFDYVSKKTLDAVTEDLNHIWGISRIVGLNPREVSAAESYLPPRSITETLSLPPPYISGSPITDDAYFYGMQGEQDQLKQAFGEIVRTESQGSKFIFVYGPKKVGKTSLVNYFIRGLNLTSYHCLTVYYQVPDCTPWSEAKESITQEFLKRAKYLADRNNINLPELSHTSLASLIRSIQESLGCSIVLAIDEAVGLFATSAQSDEMDDVRRFCGEIQNIPSLLVLWIGPEAPVRQLPDNLRHILRKSDPLQVGSLTQGEVLSLLRAAKLAPKYNIVVSDTLAKVIHRLTAGNPYWIQTLGKYMWSLARLASTGIIEYDADILGKAKERVISFELPFSDRRKDGLADRILIMLSKQESSNKGLTQAALQAKLAEQGAYVTDGELITTLEELKARGSIIRELTSWRVSAPILAEYILHTYER